MSDYVSRREVAAGVARELWLGLAWSLRGLGAILAAVVVWAWRHGPTLRPLVVVALLWWFYVLTRDGMIR